MSSHQPTASAQPDPHPFNKAYTSDVLTGPALSAHVEAVGAELIQLAKLLGRQAATEFLRSSATHTHEQDLAA
jgi:hypothetical protein